MIKALPLEHALTRTYARRGAVVGLAAVAGIVGAVGVALAVIDAHPEIDGPETAVVLVGLTLCGLPIAVVLAWIAAWLLRLPRPWAAAGMGGVFSLVLGGVVCALGGSLIPSALALIVTTVAAHAAAAPIVALTGVARERQLNR